MRWLLIRWGGTTLALWAAIHLVPGLHFESPPLQLLVVALVFGFVNALLKPLVKVLTCPLYLLTLGLFAFVVSGLMLWLTAAFAQELGIRFRIDGVLPAIEGGVVIGVVNVLVSLVDWATTPRDDR